MKQTDTSEKGLESIIVTSFVEAAGYVQGDPQEYDREHAVDLAKLLQFLAATQPDTYEALGIGEEGPKRNQFLHRLQGEIAKRGIIDLLRNGVKHGPRHIELFYGTPTPGNTKAEERFAANIFSVTRQLRYSKDETQLALDLGVFINGLPVATFELKNRLKETLKLTLSDENGEIGPVPTSGGGHKSEPEFDRLSIIIKAFNDQFGNIDWKDVDRIRTVIVQEISGKVATDKAYQNAMKNSDKAAARLEHDRALQKVVIGMLADHTELFKQFSDNPGFKKWLSDTIFGVTFGQTAVG